MSELIDNSRYRIDVLKKIITNLHDGADPEALTSEFAELLEAVGPSEIAAMENALMAEGMPQQEIQRMCDVHAAVLGKGLSGDQPQQVAAGHPVHTFRLENERIREITGRYRKLLAGLGGVPDPGLWREITDAHADLEAGVQEGVDGVLGGHHDWIAVQVERCVQHTAHSRDLLELRDQVMEGRMVIRVEYLAARGLVKRVQAGRDRVPGCR